MTPQRQYVAAAQGDLYDKPLRRLTASAPAQSQPCTGPMLRGIKKASTGRIGKTIMTVVLGLLALSFAIWGVGDIFRGFGLSALAKVGKTEIGIEQFRQIYNDRLQQISRNAGRPISTDQARAFGLDRQILGQLVAETALDERARQMGLNVSDADVATAIMSDPNFRGFNGGFDRSRFEALIRQAGYTEPRYVAQQRKDMLRRQIINTVAGDVTVPKAAVEAAYRYANEERAIEYVVLDRSQAGTLTPPSPEELAKYFEERKGQFRAPEYRKVVLVVVTPGEMAKWETINDEDARRIFEERKARYSTPEQRHVQQIVFPNAEEAQAAAAKIAQGTAFDAVAKERGLQESDIDLGTIPKSNIIDQAVADAAFALKEDEVSAPVQGRFGTALVRVLKIEPGTTQTYEQVANSIKGDIALERARAQIAGIRDKLEDARAGGKTLVEAAEELKLSTRNIEALDRNGSTPEGVAVGNLPKAAELVQSIFATDVGVENDPLQYENGYIWYDVVGITPARDRTLDEVKTEIEIRYTNEQIANTLKTKADAMVEKLKTGGSLNAIAAEDKLTVDTASGLKRGDPTETLSAPTLNAVFRTPKGAPGSAEGVQTTQRVVFRVTDVKIPEVDMNSADAKRISDALRSALGDELLAGYGERLEKDVGVTINPSALNQVTGGGTTTN
jgi:peptidyl-prolyl cis-trans isomerase D